MLASSKLVLSVLIWAMIAFSGTWIFAIVQKADGATDDAAPSASEDLPQHALWRFGDFGESTDSNGIYRLKYSRDGRLLATRNRENVVAVYDVKTQKQLCEVNGHENNWVETIDFSPDSKFFVTAAGSSERVKIWNVASGKLEGEIETDGTAAYFSRDGNVIRVLGETHVESYSWPGVQMTTQRKWKSGNLTRAGMSADGSLVVAYRALKRRIYQTLIIDLDNKSKVTLDGPTSIPKSVAIAPNHLWVAAAYHRDPKVRLWDLRDPGKNKFSLDKHNETVQSLSISEDNRFLVSSSWDESVIAWDLSTRQPIGQFKGHKGHVNATAISPLDYSLASGASGIQDCSTIVWTLKPSLVPEVPATYAKDFDRLWKGMGASSIRLSMFSMAALIEGEKEFLDPLQQKIGPLVAGSVSKTFEQALEQLGDPKFAVREKATHELIRIRGQSEARLRRALEDATSPELRYRISKILQTKLARPISTLIETRRWARIVLALELINSERSQEMLDSIANGHQDIDIARDARASFERNELRKKLNP